LLFLDQNDSAPLIVSAQHWEWNMLRILRENSLTIVLSLLFLIFLVAQSLTGWFVENSDREDHHQPEVAYTEYLESAHFLEATMENWESEFLQMSAFVILTVFLYQKGSAESKKLEGEEKVDRDPKYRRNKKECSLACSQRRNPTEAV
jgi:hypothetical protein